MQAEKPEALWYHRVMTEPQKPKSMVPAVLGMAAVVAVFAVRHHHGWQALQSHIQQPEMESRGAL